ncbi:MAG TPA: alpha/beta hydrolase [Bacillota bacterium]|nr:alpha/beta hydrolase [Bacillota bacterium]
MTKTNSTSTTDKTITLRDGRMLGYAEFGNPEGKPLFYFHGHPGCRLEAEFLAFQAEQADIRLIGIDRPGMGLSSFKAGRSILDWPDDVLELADYLKIDQFAVAGFSGGGPYAIACAYKIPNRLTACGIIAGVGKVNLFLSFLSRWLPWLLLPMARRFFNDQERAMELLLKFSRNWPKPDRNSLFLPGIKETMAASLVEALRQGSGGAAYDGTLLGGSWGFDPEEITFPKLYLWHGALDREIPVEKGEALAKRLVHCKAAYYPDEGHISLIAKHQAEIVRALCGPV